MESCPPVLHAFTPIYLKLVVYLEKSCFTLPVTRVNDKGQINQESKDNLNL